MAYDWVDDPQGPSPTSLISLYLTRSGPPYNPVAFDVAITVDNGSREDTAEALGQIKDALEALDFAFQDINTGSVLRQTLEEV